MSNSFIPAALLSVAALTSPTHAEAYRPGAAHVRTVSVRDLDLTNPKDVALLDQRIMTAVKQVCPPIDSMDLLRTRRAHQCRDDTLAHTRKQRNAVIAEAWARRVTKVASRTVR